MDLSTIISVFFQVVDVAIKYGPQAIADFQNVYANLKLVIQSATSGTPLTADQQKQVDDALALALAAEQKAFEAQQAQL